MPTPHHVPQTSSASALAELSREWIDAWNARDLERVLSLYSDDVEMTSVLIPKLGFDASGTVHGKTNLRTYWSKALQMVPDLHFTLIDTFVSPDSLIVFYENERGNRMCEYLRLDAAGKIRQGSANHLTH